MDSPPTWRDFEVWDKRGRSLILRTKRDLFYDTPYGRFMVPKHTLTDGASIPSIFWGILGPHGDYFYAAVLHDYLYSPEGMDKYPHVDRELADLIFDYCMEVDGVPFIQRLIIVLAVRSFGWVPYRRARKMG